MSPPQELEEPDSPESLPPTSSETATRSSSPTIRTRGFTRVEDGGLARSLAHGRDTDRSMPLELGKEDQNRRKPMSPVERAAREGSRIQKKSVRFSDDTDYYPSDTSEEDEAVTMNQPMWSAAGPSEPSFSSGNVWKEYQTADGRSYFFNELLGLSQWSVPEGSHILRRGPTGWVPLDHRAHSAQPQALPVQAQPTSSGSLPLERQSSDQFGHADNQEEVDSGAQYEVPGGAWDWMNEARDRERESPYERKILKFTPLKPQAFPNRGEPPDIEPEMQRDEPDLIRWRKAWEEVTGSTAQEVEQASRERSHDIQASLLAFSPRYSRRADQRAQKLLSNPTRVSHFDYAIKSRAKKPEKIPPPRSIYHSVSQYSFGTGARARTYEVSMPLCPSFTNAVTIRCYYWDRPSLGPCDRKCMPQSPSNTATKAGRNMRRDMQQGIQEQGLCRHDDRLRHKPLATAVQLSKHPPLPGESLDRHRWSARDVLLSGFEQKGYFTSSCRAHLA